MSHFSQTGPGRGRPAFTVVELLTVVAIIALLLTILVPSLSRAKELGRRAVCATNLHSLGRGWAMYWNVWDHQVPHMWNPKADCPDDASQWNHLIWAGNGSWGNTTAAAQWMNAGVLHGGGYVGTGENYVCPTVEGKWGRRWFSNVRSDSSSYYPPDEYHGWPYACPDYYRTPNSWPPINPTGTHMTYGTRRMNLYDDPALASLRRDPANQHLMFSEKGVNIVKNPTGFAYMADNFGLPEMALLSHVPGVNVLNLDGHVWFYDDGTGRVLYDNKLLTTGYSLVLGNYVHDDIWMIMDGYHAPPPGG